MAYLPQAEAYVEDMLVELNLDLDNYDTECYIKAAEIVVNAQALPKLLDPRRLHQVMFDGQETAGEYRQSVVFCYRTYTIKERPRAAAIPELMKPFRRAYKRALCNPDQLMPDEFENMAWAIAAGGRCLHPFVIGNTRIFHLVENHIRQVAGLPWITSLRSKKEFESLREQYRLHNKEFYGTVTGA